MQEMQHDPSAGSGSVLMAVYGKDNPEYLSLSLQSLVDQTCRPAEVVLVEDGPIGSQLANAISSFEGVLNIHSVKLERNLGLGAALSIGLETCHSDIVFRIDADDIARPDRLQKQFAFLAQNSNVDIVGSFAIEIDRNGVEGMTRMRPVTHTRILNNLWANPFIHSATAFRRHRVLSAGGYDPSLRRRQDYELWFRCARHGLGFANIDEPLMYYRFDKETHKRQPLKLAYEQSIVGCSGARSLKMHWWKQLACFVPLLRSLFPVWTQHSLYRMLSRFDPRVR